MIVIIYTLLKGGGLWLCKDFILGHLVGRLIPFDICLLKLAKQDDFQDTLSREKQIPILSWMHGRGWD